MKEFLLEMAFAAIVVVFFLSGENTSPDSTESLFIGADDVVETQTMSAEVLAPVEMQFQTVDFTHPGPADTRGSLMG